MKLEAIRRNAEATINAIKQKKYTGDELPPISSLQDAERIVYLCDNVFPSVTDEEKARIRAIPVYSTDYRAVNDIKEKYGLSWNELKFLRDE